MINNSTNNSPLVNTCIRNAVINQLHTMIVNCKNNTNSNVLALQRFNEALKLYPEMFGLELIISRTDLIGVARVGFEKNGIILNLHFTFLPQIFNSKTLEQDDSKLCRFIYSFQQDLILSIKLKREILLTINLHYQTMINNVKRIHNY
jgi:hypothetical protein